MSNLPAFRIVFPGDIKTDAWNVHIEWHDGKEMRRFGVEHLKSDPEADTAEAFIIYVVPLLTDWLKDVYQEAKAAA